MSFTHLPTGKSGFIMLIIGLLLYVFFYLPWRLLAAIGLVKKGNFD